MMIFIWPPSAVMMLHTPIKMKVHSLRSKHHKKFGVATNHFAISDNYRCLQRDWKFFICRLNSCWSGRVCSKTRQVNSGVPQGSILWPTLFIQHINDLVGAITNPIIQYRIVAIKASFSNNDIIMSCDEITSDTSLIISGVTISSEISYREHVNSLDEKLGFLYKTQKYFNAQQLLTIHNV